MPCFFPIQAFRSGELTKNGKRAIVFDYREADTAEILILPCGRCDHCRLERSRMWAVRCMLEASMYDSNCFITLTFSPENLPADNSLDVRTFQLFMKRLRKKFGNGIRFFHCGEYGDKYGRPHYHAILFGIDFPDKYLWKLSGDNTLYRSPILEELWPYGHSSIGAVTFESIAYVARYVLKKKFGADSWVDYVDVNTGAIRKPEYITMSRRPGIGKTWFDKYGSDVYPHDFLVLQGRKLRPPKYFDRIFESIDPDAYEGIVMKRQEESLKRAIDHATDFPSEYLRSLHLDVLRRHKELSVKRLVRVLDSEC